MNSNSSLRSRLQQLSTSDLAASLSRLANDDRATLVSYLWHLAVADEDRKFLGSERPSLFAYCTEELRLCKSDAGRRIAAARLLAKFPGAEPYLADGRLNLSTFLPLKEVLTPANAEELLERAAGLTAEEVEILVATLRPRPDVPESFRAAPTRKVSSTEVEGDLFTNTTPRPLVEMPSTMTSPTPMPTVESGSTSVSPSPPLLKRKPARARFEPLSADRFFLKLTVSGEFKALINKVKELLSHKLPNASYEDVVEECLRRTLEQLERQKFGALSPRTRKKSPPTPTDSATPNLGVTPSDSTTPILGVAPANSSTPILGVTRSDSATPILGVPEPEPSCIRNDESIPRPVKRAVYLRDEGCCAFVAANGRRCRSTYRLEFHHDLARAHGGPPTVENIFLYCHAHNQLRAREDFGDEYMARFSRH